jgi:hypothetical protein
MTIKLTVYQQKILARLRAGDILSHGNYGHNTPAARFWGKKKSGSHVNYRSLEFLEKTGLIQTTTGRFEGSFVAETFYHLPGDKPWTRTPKHVGTFKEN